MDRKGKTPMETDSGIDWDQAELLYTNIIACEGERRQVQATLELARISRDAPEPVLAKIVPILVRLLDGPRMAIQAAAAHALCGIARRAGGNLCPMIGELGAIPVILKLLPQSEGCFRRMLLRCLSTTVACDSANRAILARSKGLETILNLIAACKDDTRQYLLEILSSLAMLREVRRVVINLGGLPYLIEAVRDGRMASRVQAANAIGLLGVARRVRHVLADKGAVPALIGLLGDGDTSVKLIAANALGVISSHVDFIRPLAQAGVIPLYVELLKGPEPLGREIAEDVFCLLAVAEENAVEITEHMVRILKGNEEEAKSAALDVLWDLSGYRHSIPFVRDSGAIPLLLDILRSGNGDTREKASGAVAQLSYDEPNKEALLEAGAIPLLLDLLRGELEEVREFAAEALMNFAEDPLYHGRVSEAYSIPSFVAIQDRLNHVRPTDEHVARSMRLMSAEQLTSEPELTSL